MTVYLISTFLHRSPVARIFGGACAALLAFHPARAAEKTGPVETTTGKGGRLEKPMDHGMDADTAGNETVIREGAQVTLDGKLQGGMMGIGGETTGRVLTYQTKSGPKTIDVDCSALDAAKIPEGAVRITGKVFKKDYVERGPTLILKAATIEKQP